MPGIAHEVLNSRPALIRRMQPVTAVRAASATECVADVRVPAP